MSALPRPSAWLRAAAVLTALYALLHAAGRPWSPAHDVAATAVAAGMRAVHFSAEGLERSYWDFYQGFGIAISVLVGAQALLLWQLATLARDTGRYRAMALIHLGAMLGIAVIAARFIFALPALMALLIAACLGIALLGAPEKGRSVRSPAAGL